MRLPPSPASSMSSPMGAAASRNRLPMRCLHQLLGSLDAPMPRNLTMRGAASRGLCPIRGLSPFSPRRRPAEPPPPPHEPATTYELDTASQSHLCKIRLDLTNFPVSCSISCCLQSRVILVVFYGVDFIHFCVQIKSGSLFRVELGIHPHCHCLILFFLNRGGQHEQ